MTPPVHRGSVAPPGPHLFLPDFCDQRATLAIVLIGEITAVVLTLSGHDRSVDFWTALARESLFLLWIGLAGAALLCALRAPLQRQTLAKGSVLVLALMGVLVALISEIAYQLAAGQILSTELARGIFPGNHAAFVARNVVVGLIVTALVLRYFYVMQQWRRNVEMQAKARVYALQARIRPHFLFNSMNTIAALTRSDPARAEEAVQDLADLFRASLSEKRNEIPLAEELEVARTYQRIEQLRLGARLKVTWNVEAVPLQALVPGLIVQPLLENAIYHGIEPLPDGGTVTVTGENAHGNITIIVKNPVGPRARGSEHEGHHLALGNIRERLELTYGTRATVKAGRFDDEYIVTLRFPHIESSTRLRS